MKLSQGYVIVAALALAGCSAGMARSMGILVPGVGVTDGMRTAFCESPEVWAAELEAAKKEFAEDRQRPSVGMPACRVLARLGAPSESRSVEVAGSPAVMHWTYWETPAGSRGRVARLVVIAPGPDQRGVVESVVW